GVSRFVGPSIHAGSASVPGRPQELWFPRRHPPSALPGALIASRRQALGSYSSALGELSMARLFELRSHEGDGDLLAIVDLDKVCLVRVEKGAGQHYLRILVRFVDGHEDHEIVPPQAAQHVEPLAFPGDPDEALTRLKAVLANLMRTRLVTEEADYLHAECSSLIFRFVDDLEFSLDRLAKKIHVRSASRAGKYDFGVNRRRAE